MADLFERVLNRRTPLGQYQDFAHGYFSFPKLEGEIGPEMYFRGKKMIVWSINNYLGLANHPEVRKTDAEAAAQWGLAYPMGARMMSGQTKYHEELERQLAEFVGKEASYLLNYGYMGMVSIIDAMLDRHDVLIIDSESHACIYDGSRLHMGRRFTYEHNNIQSLEKQLQRAEEIVKSTGGGILVVTEGVFGMAGDLGKLDEIVKLKEKYQFRLLVDDAHGFGTMGKTGAGTGEHFGVQDGIDLYFSTFAKSMAAIGAFVASTKPIIKYLRYTMRSQIFAKSLPLPIVIGAMKRLELLRTKPELREKLWSIVRALQGGLKELGFDLGRTNSPVTPVYMHGDPFEAAHVLADLRENYNIFCSGVIYPVVPKGVIMFRLIPTAAHELEHVQKTIEAFKEVREKLNKGYYKVSDPMEIIRKYNIQIED
jgi:glycine C-acetyltransferase